jgi:hypothetical protein
MKRWGMLRKMVSTGAVAGMLTGLTEMMGTRSPQK